MSRPKKHYSDTTGNPDLPEIEEKILDFWKKDNIFRKSVENRAGAEEWIFYDGPPFANGLPHYGHLLTSAVKDIFARYHTMKGQKVERRFGWDCHGLPAEMEAEKELNVSGRKAIEDFGIDNFNKHCRTSVMKYTHIWEDYVNRAARWVDFENDYKTMDTDYMESVLWAFKQLYDKGLIYQSQRVMPYSWAAQTPLSNFETRMDDAYRDVEDKAITVAFKLKEKPKTAPDSCENYYLLAWTTTPWTLPSNLALAVASDLIYTAIYNEKDCIIMARSSAALYEKEIIDFLGHDPAEKENQFPENKMVPGSDLLGLSYEPLFPYFENISGAFKILSGNDFIQEGEGTGIVHLAPGFGEDDQRVCEAADIPVICPVDEAGRYTDEVFDIPDLSLKGLNVVIDKNKSPDEPYNDGQLSKYGLANLRIIKYLKEQGQLVKEEPYKHSYPHCWRTDQKLIYKALPSWYVEVTKFKDRMVELNRQINWIPEHIRDGQFGKWLENARDWSISRNRFWGTPIPVWRTESGKTRVFGSIKELEGFFEVKVEDLHRPFIDNLTKQENGETWRRVTDVFDCWFESGSMPFAQVHYPFENKKWFEGHFPADFIVEYIGQTRGWFYTLLVLAAALFDKIPFKNCICHGILLAEDGKKLSKKLRNYPDPNDMFKQYGADAVRLRMVKEPVMHGGNLLISKDGSDIRDVVRLSIKPLWNAYHFFTLYANTDEVKAKLIIKSKNLMDRYILFKLKETVGKIEKSLDNFYTPEACQAIDGFFEVLNNWYIRRSRERFWSEEHNSDKQTAYDTLYTILVVMCRAASPLLPFVTEEIYRNLTGEESVHLTAWPDMEEVSDEGQLVADMDRVRDACNSALAIRNRENIRIRQPLAKLVIAGYNVQNLEKYKEIMAEELNVKEVEVKSPEEMSNYGNFKLELIYPVLGKRLKDEGLADKMKDISAAIKAGKWTKTETGKRQVIDIDIYEGEYKQLLEKKNPKTTEALSTQDALVVLDLVISPELKLEGLARDIVRIIQQARKEADLHVADRINLVLEAKGEIKSAAEVNKDYIAEQTLAKTVEFKNASSKKYVIKQELGGQEVIIGFEISS